MKKSGLLLITMVVLLFAACAHGDVSNDFDGGVEIVQEEADGERSGGGLFTALSSTLALESALNNLNGEFSERMSTTPLTVFELLADSLTYGTTNLGFEYSTEWTDWNDNDRSEFVSGDFSFHSDAENTEFALRGDISFRDGIDGLDEGFDFEAYLNAERFAIGSSMAGGVYGINFDTFPQDILRLANEAGISAESMEMLEYDFREAMLMYNSVLAEIYLASYSNDELTRAFMEFLQNNETVTENEEVNAGGENVNARRVTYRFTVASIADLLRDILNITERDEYIRSMVENAVTGRRTIDDIYSELRDELRYFEHEIDGEMSVSFLIGPRDRLLRIEFTASFIEAFYKESVTFNATLDFGGSATDTWRFDFEYEDIWSDGLISIVWESRETSGRNIHDITMTLREGNRSQSVGTLTSDWDMTSGDFTFSVTESGRTNEFFGGNLIVSGDTFRLRFEHTEIGRIRDSHFTLNIHTARGANIGNVSYRDIGAMSFDEIDDILFDAFGVSIRERMRISMLFDDAHTLANALNRYNREIEPDQQLTSVPAHVNGRFELIVHNGHEELDFSVQFESAERADEVAGHISALDWGRGDSRVWFEPDYMMIYGYDW